MSADAKNSGWMKAFSDLPILDAATCSHIHLPIYDCGEDLFNRPCSHETYERREPLWYNDRIGGFTTGDVVQKLLRGPRDALVNGGDHLCVFDKHYSGGTVWRVVRTGANQYHTWKWAAGYRDSAHDVDPPFEVNDLNRNPQLWLDRMKYTLMKLENNSIKWTRLPCKHMQAKPGRTI